MKLSPIAGRVATLALALVIIASSCRNKKDDNNVIDEEKTGYAEEQLILEQIYDNADRVVDRAFSLGSTALKGGETPLAVCVEIKHDTTGNPDIKRMIIDFGGSNCLGYDGRYRRGKLIVDYTKNKKISEKGYYHKITFDNYVLDGHMVGGHKEVWNWGNNTSGNVTLDIASVDTIYLPDNSGKVTGASERKREWYSGSNTPQTADDVYRITGFGHFTRPNGDEYYIEIAKPLIDALSCSWLNEGVINIFPEGASQRVIDFGEGACENDATINVNGVVRKVKIP